MLSRCYKVLGFLYSWRLNTASIKIRTGRHISTLLRCIPFKRRSRVRFRVLERGGNLSLVRPAVDFFLFLGIKSLVDSRIGISL